MLRSSSIVPAEPMARHVLVLSPDLDQAQAIMRCLGGAVPDRDLKVGHVRDDCIVIGTGGNGKAIADVTAAFDVVVPTGSRCTAYMLRRYGCVRLGQIAMDDAALKWFDKPWSLTFAEAQGIAVPRTWQCADEIPPDLDRIFYKPGREGVIGERSWVRRAGDLPADVRRPGGGFIFQEVIPGAEVYSYGFLADRGRTLAGVGLLERFSCPPDGGSAALMELYDDARLVERAERLIAAAAYSGWGLVEFKWCPRREDYVLMEINPKFWASLELALRTQPRFPKLLFDVDVAAEPIRRMWWPSRVCMMGIDNWPWQLAALGGAHRARERLGARPLIFASVPFGLQEPLRKLGRKVRDAVLRS